MDLFLWYVWFTMLNETGWPHSQRKFVAYTYFVDADQDQTRKGKDIAWSHTKALRREGGFR